MSRRAMIVAVVWACVAGFIVALLSGNGRALSLQVWLAVTVVGLTLAAVGQMHEVVPLVPSRFRSLFFRTTVDTSNEPELRQLRSLQFLIMRAGDNARVHQQQLRPRLVELAAHYLPLNHGVDLAKEPDRAQQVLEPVGWVIDTASTRQPTLADIERFVTLLVDPASTADNGVPNDLQGAS